MSLTRRGYVVDMRLACLDQTALQDQVLAILRDSDVPLSTGQLGRMLPKVKGFWVMKVHDCPGCKCGNGDIPVFEPFFHDGLYEEAWRIRTFLVKLEKQGLVEVFRPGVRGKAFSYRWIGDTE